MLEFKKVSFTYEDTAKKIIENLSLRIDEGKFYSIIGSSGCGKSTIFKLISKLLKIDSGSIEYKGRDIYTLPSFCAYMPQKDMLFMWRTISKNLALPLELRKLPKRQVEDEVSRMLKNIGLTDYAQEYPSSLSGGMRQRAAFGRTLLTKDDLLLLDEPFSALDALSRLDLQDWLKKVLASYKKTSILITHDVEEALYLSDEILVVTQEPISELIRVVVPVVDEDRRANLDTKELVDLKRRLIDMIRRRND